jgi:hypothetical protein
MHPELLRPEAARFYVDALTALTGSGVPFLVGGAYAFERYTGIARDTKDLDIFVHPRDCERVLDVLAAAGYRTEITFPHWLGKAHCGEDVLDVIYSSGNGVARVDDGWFEHAVPQTVLGVPAMLCPPEETIWSKSFIMERERFDGADVAHLLRACAATLDWTRLLRRFGPLWRVLFAHFVLFGFVYPSDRALIPAWVMDELARRLADEHTRPASGAPVCAGTLVSRAQYLVDIDAWGLHDARLLLGTMGEADVDRWTAAIEHACPKATDGMQESDADRGDR